MLIKIQYNFCCFETICISVNTPISSLKLRFDHMNKEVYVTGVNLNMVPDQ